MEPIDNNFTNVCKKFMRNQCDKKFCNYIHDPQLCRHEYRGNCKNGDKCNFSHSINHNLINQFNNNKNNQYNQFNDQIPNLINKQNLFVGNTSNKNKNKNNFRNKSKVKNTETFVKDFSPPEMRVQFEHGQNKTKLSIQSNDVIVVPDLFSDLADPSNLDIYSKLLQEVNSTKFDKNKLIHEWHEGCHLIVDDHYDWKKDCPTFNYVIDKIKNYFSIDIKATRFNIMENLVDWKAFHYDGAAIKPDIALIQNFTIGVSFGYTRDIAFQVANHKDCRNIISFPLQSGTTYAFAKDVNIDWRHGVLPINTESDYSPSLTDGRISIVAWGKIDQLDMKPDNHV